MKFQFDDMTISVNMPDRAALLSAVRDRLSAGTGFTLATINLDHLVKLSASPDFLRAYAGQDWVVADGNPIVWLSRLARRPVSLVPGSDLIVPICREMAAMNLPVSLVGTTDPVLSAAATNLQSEIPGLKIGEKISPSFGFDPVGEEAQQIMARIATLGPGLCLLALGAPKQEMLAVLGRKMAAQTGFVGIGASLDFIAGHQTRAPKWVQAMAMEWLWRAMTSPRRLIPRYLACIAILPSQVTAALRLRKQG